MSVWRLENTGATTYNGFTFTDSAGVNKSISVLPNLQSGSDYIYYYVDATDPVTAQGSVVVSNVDTMTKVYEFSGCCFGDTFYFSGTNLFDIYSVTIGDVFYFRNTITSANPNVEQSSCYQLVILFFTLQT